MVLLQIELDDYEDKILIIYSQLKSTTKSKSATEIINLFGQSYKDDMLEKLKNLENPNPIQNFMEEDNGNTIR